MSEFAHIEEGWPLKPLLLQLAARTCEDFPYSDCATCDGTGLWCEPCLARAALTLMPVGAASSAGEQT